jgi:hypothetical protein
VPPLNREERVPLTIFAAVFFAEHAYRYARKGVLLLRQPVLWPTILFFIPKINLIGFRNETAGIRFDDSILLVVAALLLFEWIARLDFTIDPFPLTGFAVVGVFCLSNLINSGHLSASHASLLYSLRLAEYMIFFWTGKCLIRSGYDFDFVVKAIVSLNCVVVVLQFTRIVGGFTAQGYESIVGRPFGITANHPAEMGALFNLLFAAVVFGTKSTRFWLWSLLIGTCIFITESRSALLAHILLTLIYAYRHSKSKIGFSLKAGVVAGLLVAVFAALPGDNERSANLFSRQNLETFRVVYDNIPVDRQFADVSEGGAPEDSPEGVDVSWYIRGVKWAEVVKTMLAESWTVWILGVGPGAIGIALDGGWLRQIAETGIVGTIAFLVLLRKISSLSAACSMAVLALAVNMFMIDAQLGYKVMAFLFFLAGAELQRKFKQSPAKSFDNSTLRPA